MTDINIEVAISNDEPSFPLSDGNYWVEFSALGIPLVISHYQVGPPGRHELVAQPTNLPDLVVQTQGQMGTNDPLTSSHGPEYTIPLRLKALDSDFQHLFSIDEKVNQYYNDAIIQYDDNGQTKSFNLYSPDDVATQLLSSYTPGSHVINTPQDLADFFSDYQAMLQDPDLEKRMSHYNLEWEDKNQIILDAFQGNNGLQIQQILWDVYDFANGDKPKNFNQKAKK